MGKVNSLQDLDSIISKKKRKHELYDVYEQVDIPQKKVTVHFLNTGAPSKKEIQELLYQNFDLTIKTLKENQKKKLKEALLALDTSDIVSDYVPNYSNNKNINNTKKIVNDAFVKVLDNLDEKDVQNFVNSVDLSKKMMENKAYMGIVSNVNKKGLSVIIGSQFGQPAEYDISYESLPDYMKKKTFHKGLHVFIDIKRNYDTDDVMTTLVSRKDFDKPRLDELKNMNIDINGYKTIFYKTKSGKLLKGKIIGLGDDVFGKQVVFETKDGKKKFPITIDSLKEGIIAARKSYLKHINTAKKQISTAKKQNNNKTIFMSKKYISTQKTDVA